MQPAIAEALGAGGRREAVGQRGQDLDDEREFLDLIAHLWAESADGADFHRRMGNRLLAAKEAYLQQRSHDDKIFGNCFSPDQ